MAKKNAHRWMSAAIAIVAFFVADSANVARAAKRYYTTSSTIERSSLEGSSSDTVVSGLVLPSAVTVDLAGGHLYWTEPTFLLEARITRADLDGSNVQLLTTVPNVRELEVDFEGGKIYWANATHAQLWRADLDGTGSQLLATSGGLRGIALDTSAGTIYWVASSGVHRANLDGSASEMLLAAVSGHAPEDIALDPSGERMYWSEGTGSGTGGLILAADFSGLDVDTVASVGAVDLDLDLVSDHLYYTELQPLNLHGHYRTNLDGSGSTLLPLSSTATRSALDTDSGDLSRLFWLDALSDDIEAAGIDGSEETTILAGLAGNPNAVAVDGSGGKVYWTEYDGGAISRANLDGSDPEPVLSTGTFSFPSGIALDVAGGRMYWRQGGGIKRALLDGTDVETIVSIPVAGPTSRLALDLAGGNVYFTDTSTATIQRAPMDGSLPPDTLVTAIANVDDIALDVASGKMYWTEGSGGTAKTRRADLDGSGAEDVLVGTAGGLALDPSAGKLYCASDAQDGVFRANLDGSGLRRLVYGIDGAWRVGLGVQPIFQDKVYWTEHLDGRIRRSSLDGTNVETVLSPVSGSAHGLAWDPVRAKMYWADEANAKIRRSNLDGSCVEDVITTGLASPKDVAIDPWQLKIYWVDLVTDQIARADLDGSDVEVLYDTLGEGRGLDLDLVRREVYWGDNVTNWIHRGNMDGSGASVLVYPADLPFGIAVDAAAGTVYWTDTQHDTIERVNRDGTGHQVLVSGLDQPFHLDLDLEGERLYWAERTPFKIRSARLDGLDVQDVVSTGVPVHGIFVMRNGDPVTGVPEIAASGSVIRLIGPYPNPFLARTSVSFSHAGGRLEVGVYDVSGRLVQVLDRGVRSTGEHMLEWDGRNQTGSRVAPGVYFFRARSDAGSAATVKGVMLR